MLGDFLTRCLLLFCGYAYPAFECFKDVEKNKVDIEQLRFWCQYWILVAILSVCERFSDIFISWLPMYGEAKLALIIYLWHPKTKGTAYIYGTFVRPYISKHESDIDRKILELRANSWDMAMHYCQKFAHLGQAKIFEILCYIAGQSSGLDISQKSNQNIAGVPTVGTQQQVPVNEKVKYGDGMPPNGINQPAASGDMPNPPQVHIRKPMPDAAPTAPVSPRDKLLQTRQRLRRVSHNQ